VASGEGQGPSRRADGASPTGLPNRGSVGHTAPSVRMSGGESPLGAGPWVSGTTPWAEPCRGNWVSGLRGRGARVERGPCLRQRTPKPSGANSCPRTRTTNRPRFCWNLSVPPRKAAPPRVGDLSQPIGGCSLMRPERLAMAVIRLPLATYRMAIDAGTLEQLIQDP
jgi:hypothetical protein